MSGAGFENDLLYAKNADFSNSSSPSFANGLQGDHTLWMGHGSGDTVDVVTVVQGSNMTITRAANTLTFASAAGGITGTTTAHAVIVGAGANAVVSTAVGSTGQVLQGNTGSDPTYSTATYPSIAGSSGKILISDGTNIVSSTPTYPNSASGTGTILRADGTNWVATTSTYPNTNAINTLLYASSANVMAALSTANSAILATNSSGVPSITTASGNWLNTSRTAFMAYMNNAVLNVTGDGTTTYTMIYDTEVFDQANDFNLGTSTFTAPVTGRYKMSYSCGLTGGTNINSGTCTMVTSNRNYTNPLTLGAGATTNCSGNVNVLADFDAADTATFTVISNDTGGKIDDVNGLVGGNLRNWASGALFC